MKHLFTLPQRVAYKLFLIIYPMAIHFEGELGANGSNNSQLCELLCPFARSFWHSIITLRFFFWLVLSQIVCFILPRLPFIKKILEGIKESKNPIDVILDLIKVLQGGKEENEENKEKTKEREEENSSNEEEKPKEEGENEPSGSGESDMESQEDNVNEIYHKFKINGPEEW